MPLATNTATAYTGNETAGYLNVIFQRFSTPYPEVA